MKKLLYLIASVALLTSCSEPRIENTTWQLKEVVGKEFKYSAVNDNNYTITFETSEHGATTIQGVGDCSTFSIPCFVKEKRKSFSMSKIRMSRGKCKHIDQEDLFIDKIYEADFFDIKGDELTLIDGRLNTMVLKRINKK